MQEISAADLQGEMQQFSREMQERSRRSLDAGDLCCRSA
jgi:hypothetical protein